MKILILNDLGTLSGGAEHMSLMLRDRLRGKGHDARLLTSSVRPGGLPLVGDYTAYGTLSFLQHGLQIANPPAARRVREVLNEFRPDVVHVRMFALQLSPLVLRELRQVPALLHVVNYQLICPRNTKVLPDGTSCSHQAGLVCRSTGCVKMKGVVRFALQRQLTDLRVFDRVITNSAWVRRRLVADGIRVDDHVWNGVPERPARPPLSGPPSVGFAGRFVWKKGIDVLLHAMRTIVDVQPDAKLLLLGDGEHRAKIEALASGLGLGPNVRIFGHVLRDDVERILSSVWVQAVPSRWEEPFGLVAAEAMMRGTAAVVSDSGGLSEQVEHGETGYHVPREDPAALAAALLRILGDRQLAERLGAAARTRALALFSEQRVVDRFEEIYRQLLQPGAPVQANGMRDSLHVAR